MKGLIKYVFPIFALAGALSVIACSKGNSSGGGGLVCPAGTATYDGVNCVAAYSTLPAGTRIGFYTQTSNFPVYNNGGSTMSLGSGFKTLLKNAMGVCDRAYINGGMTSCDAWASGYHDMVIVFDGSSSNQAKLVIRSYPSISPYFNYYYSLPSADQFFASLLGVYVGNPSGIFDPLVLTMTVWPINNSQGFELRANGPTGSYAWWRLMQFQVTSGKIEDSSVNFTLYIDGGNQQMLPAASGTMVRCQTQNCGISGL